MYKKLEKTSEYHLLFFLQLFIEFLNFHVKYLNNYCQFLWYNYYSISDFSVLIDFAAIVFTFLLDGTEVKSEILDVGISETVVSVEVLCDDFIPFLTIFKVFFCLLKELLSTVLSSIPSSDFNFFFFTIFFVTFFSVSPSFAFTSSPTDTDFLQIFLLSFLLIFFDLLNQIVQFL